MDDGSVFQEVVTVVREISRGHEQWAVVAAADSNGELIKMVGTTLGRFAEPGRQVRVQGRWKQHAAHGRQLQVYRAVPELQLADAEPDIYAFLRRIPHIGDKRAHVLVDRYGVDAVLNEIDADPRRAFLRVARLPDQHAADAVRWWRQQRMHATAR